MKQNNKYSKQTSTLAEIKKTQLRMYSAKPKLISKKKSNKKINIYNVPRSLFLPVSIDSFYIQTTSVYSKKMQNKTKTADLTI